MNKDHNRLILIQGEREREKGVITKSHRLPDRHLRPRIPPRHPLTLLPKPLQKLNDAPYVSPIAPEPKTDADDAQLLPDERLDIFERGPVTQAIHDILYAEERRGTAWIAHAARAQGDVVHRSDVFDKAVGEHVAGRLLDGMSVLLAAGGKLTHGKDDERDGRPGVGLFADRLYAPRRQLGEDFDDGHVVCVMTQLSHR